MKKIFKFLSDHWDDWTTSHWQMRQKYWINEKEVSKEEWEAQAGPNFRQSMKEMSEMMDNIFKK